MSNKYDHLTHEELVSLLVKRDASRKFGLVWEREEIEHENALNNDFVTVELDETSSSGSAPYENLIIEGDNFDALRYLRTIYNGAIKCIYIDPPYNTGNKDFVYNDHYIDSDDKYCHSTWLEFLYRRLDLAKDLLSEDGVLLVSINDENRSKLELLLEEIMPGKRIGSMVWRTRDSSSAKGRNFSDTHEHILVYGNTEFSFEGVEKSDKKYKNPDKDPRGPWNIDPLTLAFDRIERPNLFYPLQNPKTNRWYPCDPDRVWAYASESRVADVTTLRAQSMEEWIRQEKIIFPSESEEKVVIWNSLEELIAAIEQKDVPVTPKKKIPLLTKDTPNLEFWIGKPVGFGRPGFKKHWKDLKSHINPVGSWIARLNEKHDEEDICIFRSREAGEGTGVLQQIFGKKVFSFPKPPSLIKQLIAQTTQANSQHIILDFFAGSGTLGQAVLELNEEDDGNRRFILVSSSEATKDEPEKNLCKDVCAKRVEKIINGYSDTSGTGGNFAYMRTKRIPMEEVHVDIQHDQIWYTLQLLHSNTVSSYQKEQLFHILEMEDSRMMYLESLSDSLIKQLREIISKDHKSTVIYTWQPQVIEEHLFSDHIHIEQIPEYILKRFGEQK